MGKGAYFGVGGKAGKIKKAYIGVDGRARKVKKMYLGVEGKARLCWSGEKVAEGELLIYTNDFNVYTISGGGTISHIGTLTPGDGHYNQSSILGYNMSGMAKKDDILVHAMSFVGTSSYKMPNAVVNLEDMTIKAVQLNDYNRISTIDLRVIGDKICYYYSTSADSVVSASSFNVFYTKDGYTWTGGAVNTYYVQTEGKIAYITQLADGRYIAMPSFGISYAGGSSVARTALVSSDGISWKDYSIGNLVTFPGGYIRYINGKYWTVYGKNDWTYSTPGGYATGSRVAFAYADDIWGPWTEIYDTNNTLCERSQNYNGEVTIFDGDIAKIGGDASDYITYNGSYVLRVTGDGAILKTLISSGGSNASSASPVFEQGLFNGKDLLYAVSAGGDVYYAKFNGSMFTVTKCMSADGVSRKAFMVK